MTNLHTLFLLLLACFGLVQARQRRQISVQAFPSGFPDSCFGARELATDLGFITDVCTLDQDRALVLEKGGRIYYIKKTGNSYQNKGSIYKFDVIQAGELGLVSCVADPDFSNGTPNVYFLYSRKTSETFGSQSISRLTFNFATEKFENPTIIFGACNTKTNCLNNPSHVHTGGSLLFDPVDKNALYWTKGDSKRNEDGEAAKYWKLNEPQTTSTYLGKVMKINKVTGQGFPSNAFYDGNLDSVASRIYAMGFRNPWVTMFTTTGRMLVYDVGWNKKESVKEIYNGAVSGWPCYEGSVVAGQTGGANYCNIINPKYNKSIVIAEYSGPGACVIGASYMGSAYPDKWSNKVMLADYNRGTLMTFDVEKKAFTPFAANALSTTHVKRGPNGNVWFVTRDNNGALRELYWKWNEGNCGSKAIPTVTTTIAVTPVATTTTGVDTCAPTGVVPSPLPPGWNAITYLTEVGSNNWNCSASDKGIGGKPCMANMNSFGRPINIANRRYRRGVSVVVPRQGQAAAKINVALNGVCARMEATLGAEVNNAVPANVAATLGAEFSVWGDGKLLYNSTAARSAKGPVMIVSAEGFTVNLLGVKNLEIRVSRASGAGQQQNFIGNIGNARFLCGPNALMLPKMPSMAPTTPSFNPTAPVALNNFVTFVASATNYKDVTLPGSSIAWDVSLIHCTTTTCHEHFDVDQKDSSNTFQFSTGTGHGIGDCVFAEIRATAKDSCGRMYWKTYAVKLGEQEASCGTLALQP